jgi:glycosyltransferase involved in cell wall biosynthesis
MPRGESRIEDLSMRLLFLADARSAIAVNWVRWFVERKQEVHWVSSRPAEPPLPGLASFRILPLFPELPAGIARPGGSRLLHPAATFLRHWLIPFRIGARSRMLESIFAEVRPELVHAMRIPQEGMAAARADRGLAGGRKIPLVVSVWGDDFTFHARSSPMMGRLTRQTVEQADGLHSDCKRDIRLASDWGLRIDTKILIEPGNGGIDNRLFFQAKPDISFFRKFSLPKKSLFIVNPRGIRGVARTDTFFKIIPEVRKRIPNTHFLGLRMAGMEVAENWVRKLGIGADVTLLPALSREDMARLFRLATVTLSLTEHDGVPNVLLESMACGSFPVCGDLESIREWIDEGRNGLLVDPGDPAGVADAVVKACRDSVLRSQAARWNRRIIAERADWRTVMKRVEDFYRVVTAGG